jgi:hypothetical protein
MTTHTSDLDSFLSSTSKSSKSGGSTSLGGWKKNKDEQHGEITVWMPTAFMPRAFWCHPMNTVIEWDDKLIVVPRRWGCHEATIMVPTRNGQTSSASLQRWRNEDGTAEHPPQLCPMCILTSVIARLVDENKVGFAQTVFEWVGSDDSKAVRIMAGGIYGHFRKQKGLPRAHEVEMRKAAVRRDEAFKHDMRTAMKYLFVVVDDEHPENGLVTTVESEGFGGKVKAAIVAEGTKLQAQSKIDMRDERVRGRWDPSRTPYPFLWQYDDTKDAKDKANVIALPGTPIPDAIRELVESTEFPELPDLDPGDCFALRVELETHCKVELPWDEIFGPAEAAGLMNPPTESKDEVDEGEREERVPEVRGATTGSTSAKASQTGPVRIGPDHAAWKSRAFKPGTEFKGAVVHVLPPSDAKDDDVTRVLRAFEVVAREVAEIVSCEHCQNEMTTVDPTCPTCGAAYSEDGKLLSRPCRAEGCDTQVPLEGDSVSPDGNRRFICPRGACGTIHEEAKTDEGVEWKLVEADPTPAPAASARRRRAAAATGKSFP